MDSQSFTCQFDGREVEFTTTFRLASETAPWIASCGCTRTKPFRDFVGDDGTNLCTQCMDDMDKYLPVIEGFEQAVWGRTLTNK